LTNGPDQEQELMEQRWQQLTDETQEVAETKRQLETDLKKEMAPVKAKERDINLIKREQKAALRNLQIAKKALRDERDAILVPRLDIPTKPNELRLSRKPKRNTISSWTGLIISNKPRR
jgi:chromosome segregation ATPase